MALFNRKTENDPILTNNGKDTSDEAMQDIFDSFAKEEEYGNEPDFEAEFANIQPVYNTDDIDDELEAVNRELDELKEMEVEENDTTTASDNIKTGQPYVEPEINEAIEETVPEYNYETGKETEVETFQEYPMEDSRYESVLIPYELLVPIDLNEGMSMDGIDSLAESIADIGLLTDLIVVPHEDRFAIVSGERRYRAIGLNLEQGDMTYAQVPCKISNLDNIDIDISTDLKIKLILASANTESRKMTTSDQILLQNYLVEVYEARKANGDVTGTKLDFIIEESGMSKSTVMTNQRIDNKIIPELKEELLSDKENEPSKNTLDRIAHYDEEKQQDLLTEIHEETPLEINKSYLDDFEESYEEKETFKEENEELEEVPQLLEDTEISSENYVDEEPYENNSEDVILPEEDTVEESFEESVVDYRDEYKNVQESLEFITNLFNDFIDAVQKGRIYTLKETSDQFDENVNDFLLQLNKVEDMLVFEDDIYETN